MLRKKKEKRVAKVLQKGLVCNVCGGQCGSSVIGTRRKRESIVRFRKCKCCGFGFTTEERLRE